MPRCPNPRCQADYPAGTVQCVNPFCRCLLPEAVVAGRYRIETLIGMGGMGAVYRASDTFEVEQVALKILSFTNPGMNVAVAVERFRREARYAHQLHHKNVVPVLNFGQDDKLLYIAMPLVTGGTLKDLLKAEHPLPLQQAQRYLNDLAQAVDAIHEHPQEIIHRDIKPSNLLIHQDDGRLVVTDFGIARAVQQDKPLTQRGWSLGTEHYIAPEQEHGKAEPASDIYSMGVIAYQIFTGLLPFQAVVRNRSAELPPPSTLNRSLPPQVDAVVLQAMEIDPSKRYPSAHAFADALNDALANPEPWSAPTVAETLAAATIVATRNAIVRTIIPENPCGKCGRENRSISRFCRYCGHNLSDTSPLVTDVCQVGYVSDIGRGTQENEDMLLIVQGLCMNLAPPPRPFSLLAVADGLGGPQGRSAGGHEASRLAIETIADILLPLLVTTSRTSIQQTPVSAGNPTQKSIARPKTPPDTILEQWMKDAARQANQVIYHCNADFDTTMACTLTVALLYKHHLYIADLGDSSAYHYNASKGLRCLTNEHARPGALISSASNQAYKTPPPAGYLGQQYHVQLEFFQYEVEVDDLIVLCSDGLWHALADEHIQQILAAGGDTQQLAQALVQAANDSHGQGNVSAIVARVQ